jgi:peptide/nickel transport system permease protein
MTGAWRRFAANRAAVAGTAVLALVASPGALAPWIAPHDPLAVDLANSFADSSWRHPLGTDQLGRDTWSRLLHGARVSLLLSVSSVTAALVLGAAAGLTAAWWRGRVDALFVWAVDVLLSFPDFLLAIAVIAMLGPGSFSTVMAVAIYALPSIARIARASALGALSRDHILASRALGARSTRMVWHHVLPLCLSPIVAQATMMLGKAVLMAAGLSFLGLGVPPPEAEWGAMLSRGRDLIRTAPLGAVAPGIAITIVVLSFSMAGDGLRDALDPKSRNHTVGS